MPSLLRHRPCGVCGRTHNFCLPSGDIAQGEVFQFVCPETGRTGMVRADSSGEPTRFYMTGAVALERPHEAVRRAA